MRVEKVLIEVGDKSVVQRKWKVEDQTSQLSRFWSETQAFGPDLKFLSQEPQISNLIRHVGLSKNYMHFKCQPLDKSFYFIHGWLVICTLHC